MAGARSLLALMLALVLAPLGCGKKNTAPGRAHVDGTPHTDKVAAEWKEAGLQTQLAPTEPTPYGAAYCEEGHVEGVDAVVCEYHDDAAVEWGKKMIGERWSRQQMHTGVTAQSRRTVVMLVDRDRRDPNGKTISRAVKVFKKL